MAEPSTQWFGSGFGHNGSTSNLGACTLPLVCAAAVFSSIASPTASVASSATKPAPTHRFRARFRCLMLRPPSRPKGGTSSGGRQQPLVLRVGREHGQFRDKAAVIHLERRLDDAGDVLALELRRIVAALRKPGGGREAGDHFAGIDQDDAHVVRTK